MKLSICILVMILLTSSAVGQSIDGKPDCKSLWVQFDEYSSSSLNTLVQVYSLDEKERIAAMKIMSNAKDLIKEILLINPVDGDAWLELGILYDVLADDNERQILQKECYENARKWASAKGQFEAWCLLGQIEQKQIMIESLYSNAMYIVSDYAYSCYLNAMDIYDDRNFFPSNISNWNDIDLRRYGCYLGVVTDMCYYLAQNGDVEGLMKYYEMIMNDPYIDSKDITLNPYAYKIQALYNVVYALMQSDLDGQEVESYKIELEKIIDQASQAGSFYDSFATIPRKAKEFIGNILGKSIPN